MIKDKILTLYKYLLRGHKATSESYIKYLRKIGMQIGDGVKFHDPNTCFVDTDKPYMISIGNNVHITRGVAIVAHGYDYVVLRNLYNRNYGSAGRIVIGNNVFIGMNTTILKDVVIGDNVIIGANSLINKSIKSNSVYAGQPARFIMSIDDYNKKRIEVQKEEAISCYKNAVARGVFNYIKETWEFRWIYDKTNELHLFNSFDEFVEYANLVENE